ncbi:MAG: hypothetical protein GWM98_13535, partial [Nitrospinaceae bacterium]|nr:hypothetical protein [Nitrospinaceae bacterium]NIR55306.1 hypothetical protein [Nitrospinaceae bacterium]NIS85745.1 hypothetical protein [Nitrospinaceae bacterium]NIT82595.1 hypothetical protein [Nitrospinaceae bacterium]NIU44800.1 hypothetical protein [Nitrospinaceae bacterium]
MIIRKALLTFGVSLLTAAQIWVPAAVRAEMLDTQTALRDQFPAPSDRERLIVIV